MKNFWLVLLFLPLSIFSQKDSAHQLDPVEVRAEKNGGATLSLAGRDYQAVETPANPLLLSTTENLNLAPGISAFEGTAGTAKFSYRGMGARTQYTTSRSLVYLGEIPLTSIQGFSSFEDLNPLWLSGFSLVQDHGRYAPLALGGVLRFDPRFRAVYHRSGKLSEVYSQMNLGSFGFLQSNSLYSYAESDFNLLAGYENTSKAGWRENNAQQRQSLYLTSCWTLKNKDHLRLIAYGIKNRVEIPSSLSLEDFEENPEMAADTWGRTKGFKEYNRLISGLTYSGTGSGNLSYSLTGFYRYLDNFEPRPFNILQEQRHSGGLRYSLRKDSIKFGKVSSSIVAFGEYQIGSEKAATFENLFDSTTNSFNNVGAGINSNEILGQRFNGGISLISELKEKPGDRSYWVVKTGLQAFYQYNNLSASESGNYAVPPILAPVLGISYHNSRAGLRPVFQLYRSFSVPSLEENLDPDGSLNSNLKPELAWTAELGLDWRLWEKTGMDLHLNYYFTGVQNLIVPRVVGPDQIIATNSGSSRHTGLEFQLSNPGDKAYESKWHPHFILSGYYGRFTYLEFSDTAGSFNGNDLPGFPEWQLNGSMEWSCQKWKAEGVQLSLGILGRYTSAYFINDENTVKTEPYFLLQSWVRAGQSFGDHFTATVNLGLKNLTDTHYASMTVVNNQAFGNASPRFYYPGEPLNWYGGLALSYAW